MRILLVDDEVELTDSLAQLFVREGYAVDVAYEGETALELMTGEGETLATISYDLLIFDWMLPVRSGLELCRLIREAGSETPILFLTAKDTLDDRVEGFAFCGRLIGSLEGCEFKYTFGTAPLQQYLMAPRKGLLQALDLWEEARSQQ